MTESLSLSYGDASPRASGIYYGWVNLTVAALAMVATLPGRTQGLGLVTEPLLRDLHLDPVRFATLNLWATLIGAAFCLGVGELVDRWGSRVVLTGVAVALGVTVVVMSRVTGTAGLLVTLTLSRGFGQSALSVVSLAIVGKWFARRLPLAMGVYAAVTGVGFTIAFPGVGFTIAFPGVGYAAMRWGWRPVWGGVGWAVLAGLVPLAWVLVRRTPESVGLKIDGDGVTVRDAEPPADEGYTLAQALATPAFWAFALAAAAFGLVASGLMLFNEAVLTERGFGSRTVLTVMGVVTLVGLLANGLGGWLAQRWPVGRLMGLAMFVLAAALFALPLAPRGSTPFVMGYAVAMGFAAGLVTVVFFVCWGRVFGRRHLGAIQGAAQLLTVLGSAVGPLLLAESRHRTKSAMPLLFALAPVVAALGLCCVLVPLPANNSPARNEI